MASVPQTEIKKLKMVIFESRRIVVFTGAGISTESGISDYRSQGGLWQRYQPVTIQEFLADRDKRREYWSRKSEMYAQLREAKPNQGHLAIAKLERKGNLLGVITQNIDGLHHKAGNRNVLELHGTNREVICLNCGDRGPMEPVYERLCGGETIPTCFKCGGLLKPNTISFGQMLDQEVLRQAIAWSKSCDLMIAIGSTLVVEPAASLPRIAKAEGAKLAILNREPTPLDSEADVVIHSAAGPLLASAID